MGCSNSTPVEEGTVSLTKQMFRKIKLGNLELPNRFIVSAATRLRAGYDGVPNDIMLQYYTARSSAGLIITESSGVSAEGNCYPMGGGIFTDA
jgi:N-ethylmaleimide reductase